MHRWFVSFVVAVLAGLSPAGAADLSAEQKRAAQAIYDIKCAKCHKFYHPADYTQADWDMWMGKMSRKAKLKPAQRELLSKYLQGFREKTETK
jgi:mono/diheme cytochrome c family protein